MTRADVLRDAGRTLLLGMSGWALGAVVIARRRGTIVAGGRKPRLP